ncbi:MAG: SUF system NifU family Fe-S cluster assembly protein [Candidatus Latescibacterota bacterium]|nr:MAG: SUF system NifU family Fe-S cluster assembly protein [Candidatus Latescibacterota bacterium]
MSELRDLYQEVVLDHGRHPHNFRHMDEASHQSVGFNPLCGDKLTLFLRYEDDVVQDVSFQGSGCAISTASASLLTDAIKGKSRAEVEELIAAFLDMLTAESPPDPERLGKLAVLSGVRDFPVRVKCATLSWRTLEAALGGTDEVTTE